MATHSCIHAWRNPWTEEPDRLQSMASLELDTTEQLHFHFSLSCIGEGNGKPTRVLHSWNFPGKSNGVGCHFLFQGIFLTQELNLGLLHCRQTLYQLSHREYALKDVNFCRSISLPAFLICKVEIRACLSGML